MFHSPFSRREFLASALAAGCLPTALEKATAAQPQEVPWLSEIQRPPAQLPSDAARLAPLLIDDQGKPITSLEGWLRKRQQIRGWWLDFLKPLKVDRSRAPALTVLEEDRPEGVVRQQVRYEAEPGLLAEGYLLKPARLQGKRPGIVALHSTANETIRQPAGVAGDPQQAFGLKLARRGYVTFCPRNFLWPNDLEEESDKKLPYAKRVERFSQRHPDSRGMAKMLYDAMVAVDILAGLPEVDAGRLGAIGHSLGGKETLYLAALDERIKAAVSSEGGIGIRYSNWDAPWYLGNDAIAADFGHEHHELLAMVAPRAFLLLGGDDSDGQRSWPFIEAALPVYRLYSGSPRVGLFNHRQGHTVPPEAEARTCQWFDTYL